MGWAQVEIRIAIQSFIDSGAAVGLGFNSPQENVLMTQVCMGAIAIAIAIVARAVHTNVCQSSQDMGLFMALLRVLPLTSHAGYES